MRLLKTLLLVAFVATIVLSLYVGPQEKGLEGFMDSTVGTAVGISIGVLALLIAGFAMYGGSDGMSLDEVYNAARNLTKNKRN